MPPERLQLLWDQFLSGTLPQAEAGELLNHLRANPEELARRRSEAAIHGGLRYLHANTGEQERLVAAVLAEVQVSTGSAEKAPLEQSVMRELRRRRRPRNSAFNPWWIAGAAAAVLAVVVLAWRGREQPKPDTPAVVEAPQKPTPVESGVRVKMTLGTGRIGARMLSPADGAVALNVGETLTTEGNGHAGVRWDDGSVAELRPASVLQYRAREPGLWVLEKGWLSLDVTPQLAGQRLRIETPHVQVDVIGTRYTVFAQERGSVVEVMTGTVAVKSLDPSGLTGTLTNGDSATFNADGMRTHRALERRRLMPEAAQKDSFTDAVELRDSDAVTLWPARHLVYTRPANRPGTESLGYGGVFWRAALQPDEDSFEIWVRPRKVELAQAENRLMKVVLLASTGVTEYRLGDVHVFPEDREWVLLRGEFKGASVNWQAPGQNPVALESATVQRLSLRTEIGNIDFDFGPLDILKSKRAR